MKIRFSGLVVVCLGGLLSVAVAGDPPGRPLLCYTTEDAHFHSIYCVEVGQPGVRVAIANGTAPSIALVNPPVRPGDLDHDGDVDLKDYSVFMALFTGPGSP